MKEAGRESGALRGSERECVLTEDAENVAFSDPVQRPKTKKVSFFRGAHEALTCSKTIGA